MLLAPAYLQGFALAASLIVSIGAQNAHVLKTALRQHHVGVTVLTCIAIDLILIGAGIAGMGQLIQSLPSLFTVLRWAGSAFLLWYGLRAGWSACRPHAALHATQAHAIGSRRDAFLTILGLSLLNPPVYLETVVLLGSVGGQLEQMARWSFGIGAASASVVWFVALGVGASYLAPLFARPRAWQILDGLTCIMMCTLAYTLFTH